jgi:hypothetical protein
MSWDSFKNKDANYFNQGLRLVEVDRDGGDWAAVWRPGSGAQWWRSGISSWLDFKNQDQVYFNQGLRLVDVIITANDNITAVWRGDQGNGGQLWQSGMVSVGADANNESEFQRINRLRKQAGWELRILKTHPNDAYVMGVRLVPRCRPLGSGALDDVTADEGTQYRELLADRDRRNEHPRQRRRRFPLRGAAAVANFVQGSQRLGARTAFALRYSSIAGPWCSATGMRSRSTRSGRPTK